MDIIKLWCVLKTNTQMWKCSSTKARLRDLHIRLDLRIFVAYRTI